MVLQDRMDDPTETTSLKLLAIDANEDNLTSLEAAVREALPGCALLTALSGPKGLELARAEDPDMILLAIPMPDMDGYAVCQELKDDERLHTIPALFLTACRADRESRIKALEAGAEGFLNQPFDQIELVAQVRAMVRIKAANRLQRLEKEQLEILVDERTRELRHEVEEHKRAQEALRESEEKYRLMLHTAMDGYWLADVQGRLIDVNEAYCRMSGYSRERLLALSIAQLEAVESVSSVAARIEQIKRDGVARFESRHRRKDGSVYDVEVSVRSVPVLEGGGMVAFLRDITERKRAEAELRASEDQLRALTARIQAAREEERAGIAGELHDELGQAITGLKMDVAWLQNRLQPGAAMEAEPLRRKTASMLPLLDDLIRTIQRISTDLRPGALDDLGLVAATGWCVEQFRERTGLDVELALPVADIDLDASRSTALYRILQEALTNVVRHAAATRVEVSLHVAADGLFMEVKDNGRGILPAEIQNNRSLGLLGMRERLLPFGGTLHIHGESGRGTVLTVTIPLRRQA